MYGSTCMLDWAAKAHMLECHSPECLRTVPLADDLLGDQQPFSMTASGVRMVECMNLHDFAVATSCGSDTDQRQSPFLQLSTGMHDMLFNLRSDIWQVRPRSRTRSRGTETVSVHA